MVGCLIINDDESSVELIKTVGNDFLEFSLDKVNENQENALNVILKLAPEIIIINIDSVKIDFIEFLFDIHQHCSFDPYFIGLSSSKEKAFDSYRFNFSDFILKPLSELSIRKSFLKYQKKHLIKKVETICLKSYKDYQYLKIDNILYLKADNNTTDFYMNDGSVIGAYKTLKVFEKSLPQIFLRIHKSYIVNSKYVSRLHYGKSICVIGKEYKIPFTKTYIDNIDLINTSLSKDNMITLN